MGCLQQRPEIRLIIGHIAHDIQLFTLIEKMSRQQSEILDAVNQVLGIVTKGGAGPLEMPDELKLSVLGACLLQWLGGLCRTDMVKRVLKQFNWFGKKGKMAFGKLNLAHAELTIMKCKKSTATEVEIDSREWFRLASDREGGRKKCQKSRVKEEEMNSDNL